MEKALSISGLVVAGLIGALLALAVRSPPTDISGWLTIFVGFAAIAQALFAWWALEGVRHARTSAETALTNISLAERNAQAQLRAYLAVEIGELDKLGARLSPRGAVIVRNVGQTPAYNVSTAIEVILVKPGDGASAPEPEHVVRVAMVIGPGRDRRTRRFATFSLTDEGLSSYEEGSTILVVAGSTVYDDIFGRTWHTKFCHVFDRSTPDGRYHDEYNTAI